MSAFQPPRAAPDVEDGAMISGHLTSLFAKNGVLSGKLEHYCLVCDELFKSEEDTLMHIVSFLHKKKLNECGYLEKYEGHFIRKANGLYFCEPCSLTFPVATKVELHIEEISHVMARPRSMTTEWRIDPETVNYCDFIISDDAWNGCLKDTCVLCNIEFSESDRHAHKNSRNHVLNLLTTQVIKDLSSKERGTAMYRKIDAKTNHCLTCNEIIGLDTNSHFESVEHQKAVKLYDKNNSAHVKVEAPLNSGGDKSNDQVLSGGTANGVPKKNVDKVKDDLKSSEAADDNSSFIKNINVQNYITDYRGKKWCVLCNCFITNCQPEEHLRSEHHHTLMKLHKGKIGNGQKINGSAKPNMNDFVDKYQENNINMNLINETAFCKKCTKNIDFDTEAIDRHIEEHNAATKKPKNNVPFLSGMKSNGSERTTLFTNPVLLPSADAKAVKPRAKGLKIQEFAKVHGFSRNAADNSYYCHACFRRLPNKLSDLKAHVENKTHIENTNKKTYKTDEKAAVKKPLLDVIKISEIVGDEEEVILIVNNKYWLNAFGFFLLAKFNQKVFCHACNIDLTSDNLLRHIIKDEHKDAVEKCLVITSLEDEFIREIKLEKYHCGYCNIVEEDWDDMLDHVTLSEHKNKRLEAEGKLRKYEKMHRIREVLTMEDNELMLSFLKKVNGLSHH